MHLLLRRPVAIAYWVVGFLLAVLAGVAGATIGRDTAPTFSDEGAGAPATSGAQFLLGGFGFFLGFAGALALLSAIWLLAWARSRRRTTIERNDHHHDMTEVLVDEDGRRFEAE